jgi:hypothetical protein
MPTCILEIHSSVRTSRRNGQGVLKSAVQILGVYNFHNETEIFICHRRDQFKETRQIQYIVVIITVNQELSR